jgi:hypothetical protein
VTADIEVEFDFDKRALNFGTVKVDEPVSKTAFLLIKDPATTQITKLESTSEYVTVRELNTTDNDSGGSKVEVEITLLPSHPLGKINASVTAQSNLEKKSRTTLRLSGKVRGDIDLIPENIQFNHYQSDKTKTTKLKQIQVVNRSETDELHVLSAEDPDGRLSVEIKTVQEGQRYRLNITLIEGALGEKTYFKGAIVIKTDNMEQETLEADYSIYSRK